MEEDIIYHYCNIDSFSEIIKNKNIRLSNAYMTNDMHEMEWIFEIMKKFMSDRFNVEFIDNLRKVYRFWLDNYFVPHVACFSKDGDLLSQWRAYSDDGSGVSIGFNENYFKSIQNIENKEFEIKRVVYDAKKQEQKLGEFFSKLSMQQIELLVNYYFNNSTERHFFEISFVASLFDIGMVCKDKAFSEEKEVRLTHGFSELAAESDSFEHRLTKSGLISFIEVPLDCRSNHASIKEIIIGPKCKINEDEIRKFLDYYPINNSPIKIKKSNIAYR